MSAVPTSGVESLPPNLRQYFRDRRATTDEVCEFCGEVVASAHNHLVNTTSRSLVCVCRGCYLLFDHDQARGGRFLAVPERCERVSAESLEDNWQMLDVPVGVAFFFLNSQRHKIVGFYPSPAGATESELSLEAWSDLVRSAPQLASLAPDVEALIVKRPDRLHPGQAPLAFIAPIDVCYELVGRIRQAWQGFQGGPALQAVEDFFADLDGRAREGRP